MSAKAPQATFANGLVTQRLDLRQQLILAIREERRNLHRGAELLVRLVDQEAFRLGDRRLEQRSSGSPHVHRVKVTAVLHLGYIGEGQAFQVELDRRLHVETGNL